MKKGENGTTITVREAAALLGVSPQCLRMGIEQGALGFGTVVRMKRKVFVIYRDRFEKITGIKTKEE